MHIDGKSKNSKTATGYFSASLCFVYHAVLPSPTHSCWLAEWVTNVDQTQSRQTALPHPISSCSLISLSRLYAFSHHPFIPLPTFQSLSLSLDCFFFSFFPIPFHSFSSPFSLCLHLRFIAFLHPILFRFHSWFIISFYHVMLTFNCLWFIKSFNSNFPSISIFSSLPILDLPSWFSPSPPSIILSTLLCSNLSSSTSS